MAVTLVEPKYRDDSKALLWKAHALEPQNPAWAEQLGGLVLAEAQGLPPAERSAVVKRSIDLYEDAYRLDELTHDRSAVLLEQANREVYRLFKEGKQIGRAHV